VGPKSVQNAGAQLLDETHQHLPEARIELVDDAGHGVLQDQPEIVENLLAEFLQRR
jgi:pimeloyl-ACP methyl ester carboxylesterase